MKNLLLPIIFTFVLHSCMFQNKDELVFKANDKRQVIEKSLSSGYSPSFKDIKTLVFDSYKCMNCHTSDGIDLRTHQSYLNSKMQIWDEKDVNSNSLYLELKTGAMPKNFKSISKLELALVEKYIKAGSPKHREKIITNKPPVDGAEDPPEDPVVDLANIEANFENVNKYIIKEFNCTKCHSNRKAKGGVNLEGLAGIYGSKNVPIDLDDPLDSTFYTSVMLYDDGSSDMPPRDIGELSPMNSSEIEFVKRFVKACGSDSNGNLTCP